MRFGMMGMVAVLTAATAGMAHGERENRGLSPIILTETPDGEDLTAEQEAQLWSEAQSLFDQLKQSSEETCAMWIPSLQGPSLLAGATAAVVAASSVQAADNYVLGRCTISRPESGAEIVPINDGDIYVQDYHGDDPRYRGFSFNGDAVKVTLIKAPAHGKVVLEEDSLAAARNWYHYWPQAGYVGQDRFVMQVEKSGIKVRVEYLIENVPADEPTTYINSDGQREGHFCNPDAWKISTSFTTPTFDNLALQSLLDATGME